MNWFFSTSLSKRFTKQQWTCLWVCELVIWIRFTHSENCSEFTTDSLSESWVVVFLCFSLMSDKLVLFFFLRTQDSDLLVIWELCWINSQHKIMIMLHSSAGGLGFALKYCVLSWSKCLVNYAPFPTPQSCFTSNKVNNRTRGLSGLIKRELSMPTHL